MPGESAVRVFLSSTLRDLVAHRDDPASKSLALPLPPPPPASAPLLCFVAKSGSKAPKPDVTTTDQFGTQHPSVTGVAYACVAASLSGPAPSESWMVCFSQKTKGCAAATGCVPDHPGPGDLS